MGSAATAAKQRCRRSRLSYSGLTERRSKVKHLQWVIIGGVVTSKEMGNWVHFIFVFSCVVTFLGKASINC